MQDFVTSFTTFTAALVSESNKFTVVFVVGAENLMELVLNIVFM